jgi:hypothetical protein
MAAKLNEAHKIAIITALACFDRPSVVIAMMKKEYDIEMISSHVVYYDPTCYAGRNLKEKYTDLFHETRAAFKAGVIATPLADRAARVKSIERLAIAAEEAGNIKMALRAHEQIAKEVGDVYTNKLVAAVEAAGTFVMTGGLPNVPLGGMDIEERNRAVAEARLPHEYRAPGSSNNPDDPAGINMPQIDPELVTDDQIAATATPEAREAWEERQEKKRLIAMGLNVE